MSVNVAWYWWNWWKLWPAWGAWPDQVKQFRYADGVVRPTHVIVIRWYRFGPVTIYRYPPTGTPCAWNRVVSGGAGAATPA